MRAIRIIGFIVLAIAVAAAAFVLGMRWPQGRKADAPAPVQQARESPGEVTVSPAAQQQAGLAVAAVSPTVLRPAASTYAVALDVRPLLAARKQIQAAEADVRAAESAERASRAEYERARKLFADDRNVSQKTMQMAEATWHADQSKLETGRATLRESEAAAVQQFGTALAVSPDLARVASRQESLVQVLLPTSAEVPPATVTLSAPGYPPSKAQRIGPAAQVDSAMAGRAFLYRSATAYPAGLRLQADVPLAAKEVSGFLIPEAAIVWYANVPWVFIQEAPDRFERRALRNPQAAAGGLFTTATFDAEDRIVIRGAQLLQSESLKPRAAAQSSASDPDQDD